jgi:pimeloyl-ACP methyl ester carboxylesterase
MALDTIAYMAAERRFWESVGRDGVDHRVRLARIGTDIRTRIVGDGPPVVFLHGALNAGATWAPMLEWFPGRRCIVVDRPGTGLSSPHVIRPGALAATGARFVGDVLDGLGIHRADVVASSFGGHLALRSAAAEPDRIGRMVQMGCPALAPGEVIPPFLRGLRFRPVRWAMSAAPPNPRAARMVFRQMGHGRSIAEDRIDPGLWAWSDALRRHTGSFRSDAEMVGGLLNHRGPESDIRLGEDLLASVPTPTLFLWGDEDGFAGPEVARRLAATLPDAELTVLPASGHLPWLDHPRYTAEATARFLDGAAVLEPPVHGGDRDGARG